ncbi:MAG: ECF RNA polymerase sigma-E factor [Calditrichaeota bacterium]|nr:ECF RNA polymerase sigma-E factor [Calditrichota bacterium]
MAERPRPNHEQPYRDLTDEELMALVQQDDEIAFELLVERYQHPLMTFISRFLGAGSHTQDVLQETYIRVWRHRHHYKTVARFSTWVYTIAGNLSKTELRRQKIRRMVPIRTGGESPEDESVDVEDPGPATDERARRNEIRRRVNQEMQRLPDAYRAAVILRDLQNKSYEEIAEILNVPIGTIKSRVNRGRARLQKRLKALREP